MIKWLKGLILLILLVQVVVVFQFSNNISHLSYNDFIDNATFGNMVPLDIEGAPYENPDQIKNIDDLYACSKYVLKVEVIDGELMKNAIIQHCKIIEVIKGDLEINQLIQIYEATSGSWVTNMKYYENGEVKKINNHIEFYNGYVPLQVNNVYYVFLNDAPDPLRKSTYIFSTSVFSHFNLDKEFKTINNVDDMNLLDSKQYDCINIENYEEVYFNIREQLKGL